MNMNGIKESTQTIIQQITGIDNLDYCTIYSPIGFRPLKTQYMSTRSLFPGINVDEIHRDTENYFPEIDVNKIQEEIGDMFSGIDMKKIRKDTEDMFTIGHFSPDPFSDLTETNPQEKILKKKSLVDIAKELDTRITKVSKPINIQFEQIPITSISSDQLYEILQLKYLLCEIEGQHYLIEVPESKEKRFETEIEEKGGKILYNNQRFSNMDILGLEIIQSSLHPKPHFKGYDTQKSPYYKIDKTTA